MLISISYQLSDILITPLSFIEIINMICRCILAFALTVFGVTANSRSFPVKLNNYGPAATNVPIVNTHLQTRVMERMPLRTSGCIPLPKTVANTCTCVKTVVKPRVHNQIISVPSVQRIIQTMATPVIEKIHYHATPVEPQVLAPAVFPGCLALNGFPARLLRPTSCGSAVTIPACANQVVI